MKRILGALFVICLAGAPAIASAQAMLVTDPLAEGELNTVLTNQVNQLRTEAQNLGTNHTNTLKLIEQIKQTEAMIQQGKDFYNQDHALAQSLVSQANQLVSQVRSNPNYITQDAQLQQNISRYFSKKFPKYNGTNYAQAAANLQQSQYDAYTQSMNDTEIQMNGVDGKSGEAALQAELKQIVSSPPSNQLQALQALLNIATVQVKQMDRLLNIQRDMLTSMNAYYVAALRNGGAGGSGAPQDNTHLTVMEQCAGNNPFLMMEDAAHRAKEMAQCKSQVTNAANGHP